MSLKKNNSITENLLQKPNFDAFESRKEEHELRAQDLQKDFQDFYTISEKTLNKQFTI